MVDLITPYCVAAADVTADRLIARYGSLAAIISARPATRVRLLAGEPKVEAGLKVVQRALLHAVSPRVGERVDVSNWRALLGYLRIAQGHELREQVRVLYLDTRNRLLLDELIAEGTIDQAPLCVREIIHRALDLGAAALIIAHNHPSGNAKASRSDIDVTHSLVRAGRTIGVQVHDHLIITSEGHTSLVAEGLM